MGAPNTLSPHVLVSGAGGKTGRAVIAALTARGVSVRAMLRRSEQTEPIRAIGAQEVVIGDIRRRSCWASAVAGVQSVYHICPNIHPEEYAIGRTAIEVARAAACERFVFHSVLHPQTQGMPHHAQKLRVEEELLQSGLAYTILQPAAYMQNVLVGWPDIVEHGRYRIPYAASTRLGMVDLADVAEAAARVLIEPTHNGAIYELAGPEVLDQSEVADRLTSKLGHQVQVDVMSPGAWEAQQHAVGLGDYQIDALRKMFDHYERHGFWGNPSVLAWLLGRPPRSFAAFLDTGIPASSHDAATPTNRPATSSSSARSSSSIH
jgi:uncharacterized protein YbjT (DUF2867 family)